MGLNTEQRQYSRDNAELSMIFTDWRSNRFQKAIMLNHSIGGISFNSPFSIAPGSDILIRVSDASHYKGGYQCRGVVIWCREIPEGDTYKYAVGMEFYEPNITSREKKERAQKHR